MERWVAKFLALIGTFVLPLVCTLLPYKVSDWLTRRNNGGKHLLSYLMCFGGGIFFGTYLLHMGPEVRKIFNDALLVPYHIDYPLADLFVGVGFFVVLFSEKVVLRWNKRRMARKRQKMPCMMETERRDSQQLYGVSKCARSQHELCVECRAGLPCSGNDEGNLHSVADIVEHSVKIDEGIVKLMAVEDIEDLHVGFAGSTCKFENECPLSGTGECCTDTTKSELTEKEKQIIVSMKVDQQMSKEQVDEGDKHSHHHATRSIILILALSLHRIFEGMSIGLQNSAQNVAHLFIAVMCHETVIGFSLGLQFVKSKLTLRRLLVTSLICSAIMPLGVAFGTAMTESGHQSSSLDVANGILQAIAMGTFIYVTFFEILQEEIDPEDTSIGKIVFIALGFIMMALLDLIPEEQPINMLTTTTIITTLTHGNGSSTDSYVGTTIDVFRSSNASE